jgi:formyl-CoA transferase
VLADLGAQVVQITRPSADGADAGFPGFDHENLHRNKRSITLNLQTNAGRDAFYRLAQQADVVVENFRADVKHRLKINYETLSALNPRIVYGSISGFGQDGPYGSRPGVDQIAQGLSGLMSVTGPPGSGPWRVGVPISDLCAGLYLAHGVMAALIERERSGAGQWVQTSLLEAAVAMLDFQATRWLIRGEVPAQAGNDHPTGFPTGVFPVKDGTINIAATGDRQFREFLRALGVEDYANDERFSTPAARNTHRAELRDLVEDVLRTRTASEWIEVLNGAGVPCGPILTIDATFQDPQVRHLQLSQTVHSPTYGDLDIVRSPVRLSRTSTSLRRAAPRPGADTDDVLAEYGFTAAEIADLRASGALAEPPVQVGSTQS